MSIHKIMFDKKDGKTRQEFAKDVDINRIVSRYHKTGKLPDMIKRNPIYGDFSSLPDYQEALNIVSKANDQFDALPVEVKDRMNYNPEKFLEFVADPKNKDEMKKLGLLKESDNPDSQTAEPVQPPVPAPAENTGGEK